MNASHKLFEVEFDAAQWRVACSLPLWQFNPPQREDYDNDNAYAIGLRAYADRVLDALPIPLTSPQQPPPLNKSGSVREAAEGAAKDFFGNGNQQAAQRLAHVISQAFDGFVPRELFDNHTRAVGSFLNELYAIMVDPLTDGKLEVSEIREALLKAATRDRDTQAQSAHLLADNAALREAAQNARNFLKTQLPENAHIPHAPQFTIPQLYESLNQALASSSTPPPKSP